MKHRWPLLLAVAAISFGTGAWLTQPGASDGGRTLRRARALEQVIARIGTDYVDSTARADLYVEAARGAIASLHDPYAELLVGEDYAAFNSQLAGRAVGLAPLDPADLLDDSSAAGHAYIFPGGVGFVALRGITEHAPPQLRSALTSLYGRGVRRVVIDLRHNPGGLIEQGVDVASLFLDRGDTIATLVGRTPAHTRAYVAGSNQPWPDLQVALLVGPNTASAAELVAGALQDHGRAAVIGERTYGKGVVQTTFRLDDDVAVKFTTSRWYTPSGRSVQRARDDSTSDLPPAAEARWGIDPDLPVVGYHASAAERRLFRGFGSDIGRFHEVVDHLAGALVRTHAVSAGRSAVTPAMRSALLVRLRAEGVPVSAAAYAEAAPAVDREIGYAVARHLQGPEAEFRRRASDDDELQTALRYLRSPGAAAEVGRE